jgi:hypothetical protein
MESAMATKPTNQQGDWSEYPTLVLPAQKSARSELAPGVGDRCETEFPFAAQLQRELDEMADALDEIAKLIIY